MEWTLEMIAGVIGIVLSVLAAIILIVSKVQSKMKNHYFIIMLLAGLALILCAVGVLFNEDYTVKVACLVAGLIMLMVLIYTEYIHKKSKSGSADLASPTSTEGDYTKSKSFVLSSTSEN